MGKKTEDLDEVNSQLSGSGVAKKTTHLVDYAQAKKRLPHATEFLEAIEESSLAISKELDRISIAEHKFKKSVGGTVKIDKKESIEWSETLGKFDKVQKGELTIDIVDLAMQLMDKD